MPATQPNIALAENSDHTWTSLYPTGNKPSNLWLIPKAQQYGQKLAMYAQYPRPTGEVQSKAFHLWAHSTMPYKHKPACFGGCWPHRWSMTSSPAGMTIGGELTRSTVNGLTLHTVGASYQTITMSGAKSGTYPVAYRCEDQLGNYVDYAHNVVVDDTRFIFVDSNAIDDSGSGTIGSPKKYLSSVWTSANSSKIVVLRGGTHIAHDNADSTQFMMSNRPVALIGYPGETVYLDCSTHLFREGNQSAADFLIRDITLINIRNTDANTRAFFFSSAQNRITFDNVVFDNLRTGTVGDDNQGAIIFFDPGSKHNNITVIDCKLNSNCQVSLMITFNADRVLLERPYANGVVQPNTNGNGFYNIKDQNHYACIRGAFFRGATSFAHPARLSNQNAPGTYQEHCWNTLITTDGSNCVNWNQARFLAGGGPHFDYAGTYISSGYCQTDALFLASDVNVTVEGMIGSGAGLFETGGGINGYTEGPISNTLLTTSQLDSITGQLKGTGLSYRLTKGAELYSS